MGIVFEHNEVTLWCRYLEQVLGRPHQLVLRQRRQFHATARNENFGDIDVIQLFTESAIDVHGCAMRNARNPFFYVFFIEGGEMQISQHKTHFSVPQQRMMLVDGQNFYRAYQSESFRSLVIRIPAALARTHIIGIDKRCGTVINSEHGSPRILRDYAQNLLTHADQLSATLRYRMQDHLLDLILDASSLLQYSGNHRPDVLSFIRAHLADPMLSPTDAAHELGISVRSVHARMARYGSTFSDYLREQRLEQCKKDLINPDNFRVSLTEIAFRWGFVSTSTFSRNFHANFGMSPRDYRNQVKVSG